jgi:Flp pilus assembly protein TadG
MNRIQSGRTEGQALVLLALALIALMAMTGLVIDGGNAYAQQRGTQNGADAASEAGAVVLSQHLMALNGSGSVKTDADVLDAMNASADFNGIKHFNPLVAGNSTAFYTDYKGNLLRPDGSATTDPALAAAVGAGTIPPCTGSTDTCVDVGTIGDLTDNVASGVQAYGVRDFATLVSGIVGIYNLTATTGAAAVSGYLDTPCDASQGCALLPVTFSTHQNTCDGSGDAVYTPVEWVPTEPTGPPYTAANEAILSLCKGGEGAFGYLDYGCGTLAQQILTPCNTQIYWPTWLESQPGGVSSVEGELDTYSGDIIGTYEPGLDLVVLIPFFDGLCNEDRPGVEPPNPPNDEPPVFGTPPFPGICAGNPSGGGSNRHYHIVYMIGFILDDAEVQGSNVTCDAPPGGPLPGGNGSGGCLKGWFASVDAGPGPVTGAPGLAGPSTALSVQLIK